MRNKKIQKKWQIYKKKKKKKSLVKLEKEKKLKKKQRPSNKNLLIDLKKWKRK